MMQKRIANLIFLAWMCAIIALAVEAGASPFLICDRDETHDYYRIWSDNESFDYEADNNTLRLDLAGYENGRHDLEVQACSRLWGRCSAKAPFSFTAGVNAPVKMSIIRGD